MIRYALLIVGGVVLYLYVTSRRVVNARGAVAAPDTLPAAAGNFLGGFVAGSQAAKPAPGAVYQRLGNQAPNQVSGSLNWSPSGLQPSPSPVYRSEYGTGGVYQDTNVRPGQFGYIAQYGSDKATTDDDEGGGYYTGPGSYQATYGTE